MLLATTSARWRSAPRAEPLISSMPNRFMSLLLHGWQRTNAGIRRAETAPPPGSATDSQPVTATLDQHSRCCHRAAPLTRAVRGPSARRAILRLTSLAAARPGTDEYRVSCIRAYPRWRDWTQ